MTREDTQHEHLVDAVQGELLGQIESGILDDAVDARMPDPAEINVLQERLLSEASIDEDWSAFLRSSTGGMFVRAALVQQNCVMSQAETICRGFVTFRRKAGWPLRIPAADVSAVLESGFHTLCPAHLYSRKGHPLLFYDTANLDISLHKMHEYQMMTCFLLECLIYGDTGFACHADSSSSPQALPNACQSTTGCGGFDGIVYLVIDARSFGLFDLTSFSLDDLFRGVGMLQGSFPIKPRKIFLLHSSMLISPLINTVMWSMGDKLKERIVLVDDDFKQLHDEIAPENLPVTMGGTFEVDWPCHVQTCLKFGGQPPAGHGFPSAPA